MSRLLRVLGCVSAVALGSVGLTGGALADGMARGSVKDDGHHHHHNWSGLYFGVNAGWMGSDIGWTYQNPLTGASNPPLGDINSDSFVLGGHIGLQHQFGQIVVGLEASVSGIGGWGNDAWGSTSCTNVAFACEARHEGLMFTVGPRLGWAFSNHWMAYVTGGYASAAAQTRERLIATGVINQFGTRDRHDGWFIGGGVEYAINRHWIIGLEYMHLDFDTVHHLTVNTPSIEDRLISLDSDVVRLRLSYKIGRDHHEPLK